MDEEKFKEYKYVHRKGGLKLLICLLLAVSIIFVAAKAKNEIQNTARGVENVTQRTVSVNGEGKIYAKPDIGEINLGVINEAKTVSEAQTQSTNSINKIMAFLKKAGVEEKDVKTTNYSITPVYDYTEHKQTLRGYSVSQNLDVKIRDLAKAGDIIAGAAENGANIIGGLNFTIDDPESIKEQARGKAVSQAKEKAQKLASDLGVKLGKLINYSESGATPIYYGKVLGMGGAMESTVPAPAMPTGENEIIIDVSLTYEIK